MIGLPWWLRWYRISLQWGIPRFDPWVGKIPWRREWPPTPVFLPWVFHGQWSLVGCSPWGLQRGGHDWVTNTFTSGMMILRLLSWFLGLYSKLSTQYLHSIVSLSISITKQVKPEIQWENFLSGASYIQLVTKPCWFSFPLLDTLGVSLFFFSLSSRLLSLSQFPTIHHCSQIDFVKCKSDPSPVLFKVLQWLTIA